MKVARKNISQKGLSPLIIVIIVAIVVLGIFAVSTKLKNSSKNGEYPAQTSSTISDLTSRSVNEFFPQSIDNLSAMIMFGKDVTGGSEYKILPLDQSEITSKALDVKAMVREGYQAFYGTEDSKNANELYFFKLTNDEDVSNIRKIIDNSFSNLPNDYKKEPINAGDGIEIWAATTSDSTRPDDIRILFAQSRAYIQIRLFSTKGQTSLVAKNYIDFIKNHVVGSYIDSQYLLTDKFEAGRLDKQRKEYIQKSL